MVDKFYIQKEEKNTLVSERTRKKIFKSVLIVHVSIIGGILLWGIVAEFFKPRKEKVITVSLYTPPSNPGPPAQTFTPPVKKTEPVVKTPPKPKPKPKPKPNPKKTVKKTVRKAPKKTPKKVVEKKRWRPAKKIKVSKEVVYVKPEKTWKPQPKVKTMSKQELVSFLNQNRVKIRSNNSNSGMNQSYENNVGAYLYQLWDTPDKSVLGGRRPEVKIFLNIASNGKLLNARILSTSGISAMDSSVRELLGKLAYLPAPPNGAKKITLILEVTE